MKKWKYAIIAIAVLILAVGGVWFGFHRGSSTDNDEAKSADRDTAMAALKDICGNSKVDTLADLSIAATKEDPEAYLEENSIYVMDEEAVDKFIQSYLSGAESTAQAQGITTEQLVKDSFGYDSLDEYIEEKKQEITSFVKQRLAVYEAAGKEHITIKEKEFEELLPSYMAAYGYDDEDTFLYECKPSSIAVEMLYDKTLSSIRENQ
jgi:FKBP-type peptidyl-prolyl cis-trans isomerase (trigger factor)